MHKKKFFPTTRVSHLTNRGPDVDQKSHNGNGTNNTYNNNDNNNNSNNNKWTPTVKAVIFYNILTSYYGSCHNYETPLPSFPVMEKLCTNPSLPMTSDQKKNEKPF